MTARNYSAVPKSSARAKAAATRRANKVKTEWLAAKPAVNVYSLVRGTWTIELNGLETKSEMNYRGAHWPSTNRKAAQRKRVAEAFLVLRAKASRALVVPTGALLVRVGGKPLDRLINLPSAFKAIEDEVCKQFGVDDGPGCPIEFRCDQRPGGSTVGVVIVLEWKEKADG